MYKHKKLKKSVVKSFIRFLLIVSLVLIIVNIFKKPSNSISDYFVASNSTKAKLYDLEYNEVDSIVRGEVVKVYNSKDKKGDNVYQKIKYNNKEYFININNLVSNEKDIVKEKEMYVRTYLTVYKELNSSKILSYIKKGEKVDIIGYDKVLKNGKVNKYKIKYKDIEGYVYGKYLVFTKEDADKLYDENGILEYMSKMGDNLKGGSAVNLDYYPYEKPKFENNIMPNEVRALYINSSSIRKIDEYISFAKNNNINALVIDIKDNTSPSYDSPVMREYSITNYNKALNDYDDFKSYIKKAKDAGLYLIGRITTFKDSYFVEDHKEIAITSSSGEPFSHNGSFWPSAYNRYVWEFNVELGKEAVKEMGFNEIQFDYVRFPDRTTNLEKDGVINLNNKYNEEKAQALQSFAFYACDEIHELGAYVSIDVFGESASNYVTAYGQFWPAISNVVDVISGMPYPDHFNAHDYNIKEVVWTVPYKLLTSWGNFVVSKQEIIPTPAVVRTWIQAYNTTKSPSVVYDADKVADEIQALYDNGLKGGYMTWNSSSSLVKYKEISDAFRRNYND